MPRPKRLIPRECKTCRKPLATIGHRLYCSERCHFEACFDRGAPTECWEWKRTTAVTGYGLFRPGDTQQTRVTKYAHRTSFELYVRPIADGQCIRHACDNRLCVNPSHLLTGSIAENNRDTVERGRHNFGEKNSKLTAEQAYEIKYGDLSYRQCERKFGISNAQVYNIKRGKAWKHL